MKVVDVAIEPDSRLELQPLTRRREGDGWLVGRPETGSFLFLGEPALLALELLEAGITPRGVQTTLAERHGTDVRVGPFLQALLSAGLVRSVDGAALRGAGPASRAPRRPHLLSRRRTAWLFSRPAAVAWALLVALAAVALARVPETRPTLADLRVAEPYPLAALILLGLTVVLTWKHELAHLVAARWAGADARIGLGSRMVFPVLQTDMSGLWAVPRRRRMVAYAAGVASDAVVAALAVVLLVAAGPVLPHAAARLLRATVLLALLMPLWQLNVFLRTDLYFALSDALGCRDLHADGIRRARRWLRRALGPLAAAGRGEGDTPPAAPPSRVERVAVPAYAAILVAGHAFYAVLTAAYLAILGRFLVSGSAGGLLLAGVPARGAPGERVTAALLLALTLTLLAVAFHRRRRSARTAVRYRLIGAREL